mmetsp:Transcript_16903/g.36861  ORF Transcript_16903/g.36861 Transcript_16903/m.36861 type:complete len:215 (-) Transcript_16903:6-650(-)
MDLSALSRTKGANVVFNLVIQFTSTFAETTVLKVHLVAFKVLVHIKSIGLCQVLFKAKGSIIAIVAGFEAASIIVVAASFLAILVHGFTNAILLVCHSPHVGLDESAHVHNVVTVLGGAPTALVRVTRIDWAKTKSNQSLCHDSNLVFIIVPTVLVEIAVPLLDMMTTLEFDGVFPHKVVIAIFSIVFHATSFRHQGTSSARVGGQSRCGSGRH